MTDNQITTIKKLRARGIMPAEIAKITGIPHNTVKSYFNRHKELFPKQIRCPNCGNPIETKLKTKNKRFCNDICRNNYWNTHLDEVHKKAYYQFKCLCCGKEFKAYGNKKRKYCSRECYLKSFQAL